MKTTISPSHLFVALLMVLLFPAASFGETKDSRQEMIQKVLDLQHFNELFDEHVGLGFNAESAILKAKFKENKDIPETEKAKLLDLFDRIPKLLKEKLDTTNMARAAVSEFFEKTFTDKDLKVMYDFYSKPAGQKECTSITKLTTSLVENSTTNLAPRFRRAAMRAYEEAMMKGLVPKPPMPTPTPANPIKPKQG